MIGFNMDEVSKLVKPDNQVMGVSNIPNALSRCHCGCQQDVFVNQPEIGNRLGKSMWLDELAESGVQEQPGQHPPDEAIGPN